MKISYEGSAHEAVCYFRLKNHGVGLPGSPHQSLDCMFPAKPEETGACVPYLLLDNGFRIYLTEINLVRKGEHGILNSVFSDSANQELEILSGSEAELRYLRDTLIADAEEGIEDSKQILKFSGVTPFKQ